MANDVFHRFLRSQHAAFGKRLLIPYVLASFGPTLLTILVFVHLTFRVRPYSPFSIVLHGVILAPFSLHAVAWDVARISLCTINSGFIAWWILAEKRKAYHPDVVFLLLVVPTLIINIFGNVPLMDGVLDRFSPFLRLFLYWPTIVFVLMLIIQDLKWLVEFRKYSGRR